MISLILILIPVLAGFLSWPSTRLNAKLPRWISLLALAGELFLLIAFWSNHWGPSRPPEKAWLADLNVPWVPQLGISFHLSMDGLSLLLVILTVFLGIASVIVSWTEISERVGFFHFNLMMVLSGIIGVFLATDMILFYFFWELMLVPMYFLIAIWGHENRIYAAIKFFIFTQAGGLFMLISILGLYFVHGKMTGIYTFDYFQILGISIPKPTAIWLMLGFFAAFAVKLPIVLVHTWLPDAHTEAPTAGSVILAGLLLKTGGYGFIRFIIPLFSEAVAELAYTAMVLGAIGIVYGAILALAQSDVKRLVAYSSISHLGFVLVGVFARTEMALQGAIIQMISHGISTGALFMLVGMLQERIHTREMDRMGGLWSTVPIMGGITMIFALASMGLPGTGNFDGEFLVLVGTYKIQRWIAIPAATGLIFSAVYSLWMMYRVFFGTKAVDWQIPDLKLRELGILGIMAVIIFWLGMFPQPVLNTAAPTLAALEKSKVLEIPSEKSKNLSITHLFPNLFMSHSYKTGSFR